MIPIAPPVNHPLASMPATAAAAGAVLAVCPSTSWAYAALLCLSGCLSTAVAAAPAAAICKGQTTKSTIAIMYHHMTFTQQQRQQSEQP